MRFTATRWHRSCVSHRPMKALPVACLGLAACVAGAPMATSIPAPAPAPPPSSPLAPAPPPAERLAADSPRATSAGVTFTAPAGWTIRRAGAADILDSPDPAPGVHLAVVDVASAASADAAVAA